MMRSNGRKRHGGFSLVELVVAAAIMGIIVGAGLSLYLNQQKQCLIQEQVVETQQSVRVSMNELAKNIRMAGYGDFPTGLDPVASVDSDPDSIMLRQNLNNCHAVIGKSVQSNTMHTRDDVGCFLPGLRAYIWDFNGQSEWFVVDFVDTNQGEGWYEIHATENLQNIYDKKDNPQVIAMQEMKYYIDELSDPGHPNLMRAVNGQTPQVFAENIEDLQVTYIMKDGSTTSQPGNVNDVREIQVELCARTERQDPEWSDPSHDDGYRRRTLLCRIDARNLGL
jgi:prepilin-type N-terminal cleavage/methylation domain-containing protein